MGRLIHLSEAASLAIHCLALVASNEKSIKASAMAKQLGASRNHLAKVLQQLVRHNYLSSTRGPNGGFTLRVAPGDISLYDVYELMEGKPELEYCGAHGDDCPFADCVYGNIREKLTSEFVTFFKNRKISDVKALIR
ncbi:MAG: Rrf2 family transcriptional regulator [Bacteroidales bacterium]|nr:Rrf2 family transcriptional regulator [Lentimicrobiaceae bacterium]MDD5694405.1 Rrf2 family transcriptional regulator [Bacteroidales bacterium]